MTHKTSSAILLSMLLLLLSCNQTPAPVNPAASPEAKELLKLLYNVTGKYTISGQHNYVKRLNQSTDTNVVITGKTPLVWGADLNNRYGHSYEQLLIEAIRHYEEGYIITLMCHQAVPLTEEERLGWWENWRKMGKNRDLIEKGLFPDAWYKMSEEEWLEIVTPGTERYEQWIKNIDAIAEPLKILRDKKIPILWRPYHEMNGIWFWWGNRQGENGYTKLWKMMYDRYTNHHKLDNLVWVWNANAPRDWEDDEAYDYELFYPGNEYVDVLAADIYKNDFKQSHHDQLLELGGGKVIALGEVGAAPTPEILQQQPKWAWFMVWATFNFNTEHNKPEDLKALYHDSRVITKENASLIGLPATREAFARAPKQPATEQITPVTVKPVIPNASPEAVKLYSFLHSLKGKRTIAGQHNYPYELSRCTDYTNLTTNRTPLMWGSDFTWRATNQERGEMVEEAINRYKNGYIVTLMWHANPPVKGRLKYNDSTAVPDWNFEDSIRYISWYKMPEAEWLRIVTPGTEEHKIWLNDVDEVAEHLKKLQEANVPVLWRPYHEMNGMWFWWGNRRGENGFTKLWKMMYDRMVNHHGLNNLLWVWNSNAPRDWKDDEAYPYELFYPGNDYVDVLAADIYKNDYQQSHHDQLVDLGGPGKVISMGEVGVAPTPEILAQQPQWVWFMIWAHFNWIPDQNTPESLQILHDDARVVVKEDAESLGINFK